MKPPMTPVCAQCGAENFTRHTRCPVCGFNRAAPPVINGKPVPRSLAEVKAKVFSKSGVISIIAIGFGSFIIYCIARGSHFGEGPAALRQEVAAVNAQQDEAVKILQQMRDAGVITAIHGNTFEVSALWYGLKYDAKVGLASYCALAAGNDRIKIIDDHSGRVLAVASRSGGVDIKN